MPGPSILRGRSQVVPEIAHMPVREAFMMSGPTGPWPQKWSLTVGEVGVVAAGGRLS
jgi:hypothetical protein